MAAVFVEECADRLVSPLTVLVFVWAVDVDFDEDRLLAPRTDPAPSTSSKVTEPMRWKYRGEIEHSKSKE